jgi:hypothetical protein
MNGIRLIYLCKLEARKEEEKVQMERKKNTPPDI